MKEKMFNSLNPLPLLKGSWKGFESFMIFGKINNPFSHALSAGFSS
jgi:hypothetical protein